jgi:SPX domain protein involved in polyphosphate accumulation
MQGRARTHAGFVDCSSLNIVAFAKILKKYDKVVKWNLAPVYIKEVERSYFASSDKVTKLMTKVEDIFTKHFSHHDRRKAMAQLRPMQEHGGHTTTFFLGKEVASRYAHNVMTHDSI